MSRRLSEAAKAAIAGAVAAAAPDGRLSLRGRGALNAKNGDDDIDELTDCSSDGENGAFAQSQTSAARFGVRGGSSLLSSHSEPESVLLPERLLSVPAVPSPVPHGQSSPRALSSAIRIDNDLSQNVSGNQRVALPNFLVDDDDSIDSDDDSVGAERLLSQTRPTRRSIGRGGRMAQNKTPRRLSHIGFSSQRDVFQATQLDEMSGPEVADEIEEDVEEDAFRAHPPQSQPDVEDISLSVRSSSMWLDDVNTFAQNAEPLRSRESMRRRVFRNALQARYQRWKQVFGHAGSIFRSGRHDTGRVCEGVYVVQVLDSDTDAGIAVCFCEIVPSREHKLVVLMDSALRIDLGAEVGSAIALKDAVPLWVDCLDQTVLIAGATTCLVNPGNSSLYTTGTLPLPIFRPQEEASSFSIAALPVITTEVTIGDEDLPCKRQPVDTVSFSQLNPYCGVFGLRAKIADCLPAQTGLRHHPVIILQEVDGNAESTLALEPCRMRASTSHWHILLEKRISHVVRFYGLLCESITGGHTLRNDDQGRSTCRQVMPLLKLSADAWFEIEDETAIL